MSSVWDSYKRIGREMLDVYAAIAREAVFPSPGPSNSTEVNNGRFQYTPLTSASSFRILHLKQLARENVSVHRDRPLRGSLIEASIDAPPEYYALSYTWGDLTLCETVEIDGKCLGITANCSAALRRMMRGKIQRYVWVDSICINQADTTEALEERGRQVAMMDQIYRNAAQVNVHLGEGDAASDAACAALKTLGYYYVGAVARGPQQEFFRRKYESFVDDVITATPEYPHGKLHGVFRLPWFKRIWVVQEVVLGRKVTFYCGKYLINFDVLVAASDFGRLPHSKFDSDILYRHWRSYLKYHDAMTIAIRSKERSEPQSNFGPPIYGVLMAPALMLEATKQEDKIYALYGICKRLGFELPVPDYRKPLATIYTEAARAMLRYQPGFELLSGVCESSGWEWGLPSWVPDFSDCISRWSPSHPPHLTIFGEGNLSVSGNTPWQHEFMLDGQALSVRGRRLDILCASGLPWMIDSSKNMLGGSPIQTGQYVSSFIDCIGSWFDVVLQGRSECQDIAVAEELLIRLLRRDASHSQALSAERLKSFARCLYVLVTRSKSGSHSIPTLLTDPQEGPVPVVGMPYLQIGDYRLSLSIHDFFGNIVTNNQWKTVFRTMDGYIGLGTHAAQNGDIVAVFHGSPLAAILRPFGDMYRYVGPAYVDGIMKGEFWATRSPEDDEWFVLI